MSWVVPVLCAAAMPAMNIDPSTASIPPAMCSAEFLREREVSRGVPGAEPPECVAAWAKRMGIPDLNRFFTCGEPLAT